MVEEEDEILLTFYQESKDQLSGFDKDLLTLGREDVEFDEELANCIYRAIHTIKGGAGFFAIAKLKNLAEKMENLLDRIRRQECVLTVENVELLLLGGDCIRQIIYDPEIVDSIETVELVEKLELEMEKSMTQKELVESNAGVEIILPSGKILFNVNKYDFERAFGADGTSDGIVYLIRYDLIEDIELKRRTPWEVISELLELCSFIDSRVDISGIGTLDTVMETTSIPFYVLISSIIERDLLLGFLGIDSSKILMVDRSGNVSDYSADSLTAEENRETDSEAAEVMQSEQILSFDDFLAFQQEQGDSAESVFDFSGNEMINDFNSQAERFLLLKQRFLYLDKSSPEYIEVLVEIESVLEEIEQLFSKIHT